MSDTVMWALAMWCVAMALVQIGVFVYLMRELRKPVMDEAAFEALVRLCGWEDE